MPDGGMGAKTLNKILKKYHNTDADVSTDLLHPTVSSILSLDMIQNPQRYSMYSNGMFKHARDVVTSFKMYLIGDSVKLAKSTINDNIPTTLEPDEDIKELEDMILEESSDDFLYSFDEINFLQRVDAIAIKFEYAMYVSLALGFCPCTLNDNPRPLRKRPYVDVNKQPTSGNSYSTKEILDRYLYGIELGLNNITFLTMNEIVSDLIVTDHQGKRTATIISDPATQVIPVDFKQIFNVNGEGIEVNFLEYMLKTHSGSLTRMIQYEIQLAFARNESKNYLLERMRKTQLVVGTEISSEAKAILNNIIKSEVEATSSAKILKSIEENEKTEAAYQKIKDRRTVLEQKSAELQAKIAAMIETKGENLTNKAISLANKNYKIASSKLTNRLLEKTDRAAREVEDRRAMSVGTNSQEVDRDPHEFQGVYGLFPPGSKQDKEESKRILKAKQDLDLKKERDLIEKQLKVEVLKANVLNQSLNEEVIKNEALHKRQSEMEIQIKSHEEKEHVLTKMIDEKERMIKALSTQLDKTSDYISKAAESLKLTNRERDRVLNLIHSVRANSDFITSSERNEMLVNELVNFFGSYNTITEENLDVINRRNYTRIAYDQVLSEHCVRPTPIFSRVETERQLNMVNEWVEFNWMKDRSVRDAAFEKLNQNMTVSAIQTGDKRYDTTRCGIPDKDDDTCDQTVIDTKELYVLDVNPISKATEDRLQKHLSENLELSMHLPIANRRFMSVQFKSIGNVREYVETAVKDIWESYTTAVFKIGRERVTAVGQKMDPMITLKTVEDFISPFIRLFDGVDYLSSDVTNYIITNLIENDDPNMDKNSESLSVLMIKSVLKPYINRSLTKTKRIILRATRRSKTSKQALGEFSQQPSPHQPQPSTLLVTQPVTQSYAFIPIQHQRV